MIESRASSATTAVSARVARRWPVVSGVSAVILACALGALVLLREHDLPLRIDSAWMDEIIEHRSPGWLIPSLVMNTVGGGLIGTVLVPLIVAGALLRLRGRVTALYFLMTAMVNVAVVQVLKSVIDRPRPLEILVAADPGSFPSGHSANAAATAVVLAIAFPAMWVRIAAAVYTIAMMFSRTYLGAHWLSDTIGGALLGAGIAVIIWAPIAAQLQAERLAPSPPWMRRASRRPG